MGALLLLTCFTACSSQPELELIDYKAGIVNDKSITGSTIITEGEKEGQELVPTALYYEFIIKNPGNKTIGSMEGKENLNIKIVPNSNLENTAIDVVGFNIFDLVSGGHGYSLIPELEAGQEGLFTFYYYLGVSEENPNESLAPPAEELQKLEEDALDATLVVILGETEIARFDLKKLE